MRTDFIQTMRKRWTQTNRLQSNPGLEAGWQQVADALIILSNPFGPNQWQVIQLPTGTGKTEAITVICSLLKAELHPGVLLVTKFTKEADRLASQINELAGSNVALSTHGDAPASAQAIREAPVLIVTHSAYLNALEKLAQNRPLESKWDTFSNWSNGPRQWVIIDEALDCVATYSIGLPELRSFNGIMQGMPPAALAFDLERLKKFAESIGTKFGATETDRTLTNEELESLRQVDLGSLKKFVSSIPAETFRVSKRRGVEGKESRAAFLEMLTDLGEVLAIGRGWCSRRGTIVSVHASRLLFDHGPSKGLVLDATAGVDPIYRLLGQRVNIWPRPLGSRNYSNVTLHVSYGHRTGKGYLTEHAQTVWPKTLSQVTKDLPTSSKAVVFCHKDVVPIVADYELHGVKISAAHWGNIDGRNDWRDFDTAILFGLHHLDNIAPTNTYSACRAEFNDDWLSGVKAGDNSSESRGSLKQGFLIKTVLQAINRIRCRCAIDEEGNCLTTHIYILLPRSDVASGIVSAIQQHMPGLNVVDWDMVSACKKLRKIPRNERLIRFLTEASVGVYKKSLVMDQVRLSARTFERLSTDLQGRTTETAQRLLDAGVEYVCSGTGRGNEGYFIKR